MPHRRNDSRGSKKSSPSRIEWAPCRGSLRSASVYRPRRPWRTDDIGCDQEDPSGRVEVLGGRVVEDEGGDGGFGVHHVAFGELEADLVGLEHAPERGLIGEVGAGG